MPTLHLYQMMDVEIENQRITLGSIAKPERITVNDPHLFATKSVATLTTWDVWASGTEEPITDFDFLWIESDTNVILELTTDKDADVGTVVSTIEISANKPLVMTSDASYALHTADFATGTIDVIDQLRIRNATAGTAKVRVFLAT